MVPGLWCRTSLVLRNWRRGDVARRRQRDCRADRRCPPHPARANRGRYAMKITDSTVVSENAAAVSQNPAQAPNSILTIEEVARELKCSRSHVYNIINNQVPGVKP